MCSSSGGQNCIIQYHHIYRCDNTRGCIMQFWPPDYEYMCLKHVEAWNNTYCKTNFVHKVGFPSMLWSTLHQNENIRNKNLKSFWNEYIICPSSSRVFPYLGSRTQKNIMLISIFVQNIQLVHKLWIEYRHINTYFPVKAREATNLVSPTAANCLRNKNDRFLQNFISSESVFVSRNIHEE